MLQRDYVLEIVGQFVEGVSRALRRAARGEKNGLLDAEREIGELLDLEPQTALALAPALAPTLALAPAPAACTCLRCPCGSAR